MSAASGTGGRPGRLHLLIATAHPDDETFGCGGTTALYAARGHAVHILLATRGQAGEIAVPELDNAVNRARLGEIRTGEARAAAASVGAAGIDFLDHVDGRLADVPTSELAREVATEIRRVRADVVITFGRDGVYGHPDHLAIHAATTAAYELAADPALALSDLPAHAAARLFYQVIAADYADARNRDRGPVMLDGEPHLFVGYRDAEVTTFVDATAHIADKVTALACHRTQTGARMDEIRTWLTRGPLIERYILAASRVPAHPRLQEDLLAGLV